MDNRRKSLIFAVFAVILAGNVAWLATKHNQGASIIAVLIVMAVVLGLSVYYARQSRS
jgi:phosphotransferase system  glucose/maltose/N-acetylglucosamine-specific IIC component